VIVAQQDSNAAEPLRNGGQLPPAAAVFSSEPRVPPRARDVLVPRAALQPEEQ